MEEICDTTAAHSILFDNDPLCNVSLGGRLWFPEVDGGGDDSSESLHVDDVWRLLLQVIHQNAEDPRKRRLVGRFERKVKESIATSCAPGTV